MNARPTGMAAIRTFTGRRGDGGELEPVGIAGVEQHVDAPAADQVGLVILARPPCHRVRLGHPLGPAARRAATSAGHPRVSQDPVDGPDLGYRVDAEGVQLKTRSPTHRTATSGWTPAVSWPRAPARADSSGVRVGEDFGARVRDRAQSSPVTAAWSRAVHLRTHPIRAAQGRSDHRRRLPGPVTASASRRCSTSSIVPPPS
jgi:hypothetical protein